MKFRAIIFLLIAFAIYFGMHVFLYYSTLHFFCITAQTTKWTLEVILFLLSISFIVAMIFARLSDFILIKFFYILAAFWAGLVTAIFLSFVFAWILFFIFESCNIKFIVGILALLLPIFYCIYGVWNAHHTNIKNIEVHITNLPIYWQGKKIVHLSDMHLGRIHGVSFAEKIVEKVNNIKPDIILITGDLFDGVGSTIPDFIEKLNKFESAHGTYFVTGNHEVYLGVESIISHLKMSQINILDNKTVNLNGLQIVGLGYPKFGELRDGNFLNNISGFIAGLPCILMYHSPTNISQDHNISQDQHTSIYWTPDINFDIAKRNGINLQLSGHTHRGQIFPYNLVANYIYKNHNYGLVTEGNFNIYTTSGVGTWGPPMRTGSNSEIAVITLT